jgi:hypothetical protein
MSEAEATTGGGRRVLVVSTLDDPAGELSRYLRDDDVVKIVVPVVKQGFFDWLANDEKAFARALETADRAAEDTPGATIDTAAGESDVGLAIRDALATFPADAIIVTIDGDDRMTEESLADTTDPAPGRMIDGIPLRVVPVFEPDTS